MANNKIGNNNIDVVGSSIGGAISGVLVVALGQFVTLGVSDTAILMVGLSVIFNYFIPPVWRGKK